ncbi:hypothetical protein C0V70_09890 [Bacteriovorax stolpii]|uniref:Uncharacterized protein n=1 Tax=Bacteriovorax stolpii TaxID=960 RepID=A0A2K9NSB1_BACTC|nr:hypothetical protein [Bacteriovorax stolpii]AUN98409.1 hypothetical protein C0V70_09890 [Bacteriovorax stolpii]TDP50968.1 hypothetical protein C8D79_3707 [Bacteriovorax stolpii]
MKRFVCLIVCGLLVVAGAFAKEGGGTVVGNGAGIVESNFQQGYLSLSKIIANCEAAQNCGLDLEEKNILKDIHEVLTKNLQNKNRLVFLSEKANPGFFTTGASESYRIAKTMLVPNSPIYINTDMLYDKDGNPTLNFNGIVRILVHELGHQTGIEGHSTLDILGAKIATYAEEHTSYFRYNVEETRESVFFSVANYSYPIKTTLVMFNWKNSSSRDLSYAIIANSECPYDSESYAGIEVLNGHYSFDRRGQLSFNAWVKLSCFESFSGSTNIYRKNLHIALDSDLQITGLTVE